MRELVTHVLIRMRREVDDEQAAPGAKAASSLVDGRGGVVEEMQYMMQDGHIDRGPLDLEVIDIAVADRAVDDVVESAPGDIQHLRAEVDADAELDAVGEQLEHPTGSRADVEEGSNGHVGDGVEQRRLDVLVRDVELAKGIPVMSDALKVGSGGLGAIDPNASQPLEIALHDRMVDLDELQDSVEQLATHARPRWTVEHARSLRLAIEETGLGQQSKMTADPGLTLAEDPAELANRQLTLGEHVERAETGGFGRRPKDQKEIIHWS